MDHEPVDGPTGTVKLIHHHPPVGGNPPVEDRCWIDSHRSHKVVRHEKAMIDANKTLTVTDVYVTEEIEESAQSPRGIWYPTRTRNTSLTGLQGDRKKTETIPRHFLDFEVAFPSRRSGSGRAVPSSGAGLLTVSGRVLMPEVSPATGATVQSITAFQDRAVTVRTCGLG